jgi:heat shock protein HtpX
MWELIQSNKRKSVVLFVALGIILTMICFAFGRYYIPEADAFVFVIFGIVIWLMMSGVAYFTGDDIILAVSEATPISKDVDPRLYDVVEEMKIAAALPAIPKIYVMNEEAPNAMAVGRDPQNSAIVVTSGLLAKLNRDELQGVIAHEISHILNRDSLFMTFAGTTVGLIVILSQLFWRGLAFSGGSGGRYRGGSSRRGGGGAALLFAVIIGIVGAMLARIMYFAISRKREYLADASAARLTRYPEGLASALEKIANSTEQLHSFNQVTEPMFISAPTTGNRFSLFGMGSTHPPILERIKILRKLAHGAGYSEYQKAFSSVEGAGSRLIPRTALAGDTPVGIRTASDSAKAAATDKRTTKRALGDLMMTIGGYQFLNCACGLTMKLPPDLNMNPIVCPRCGQEYTRPQVIT